MGLDITAYSHLKAVPRKEGDDVRDYVFRPRPHDAFPGRTEGLDCESDYIGDAKLSFCAGSYGGYSQWREWLARVAGYPSINDIWDGKVPSGPFVELINFSDCEGTIGPVVAAKLAKDFADFDEKARADDHSPDPTFYYERYKLWRQAFEIAAMNGAVDLH